MIGILVIFFQTFFLQLSKCKALRKQTDIYVCMTEDFLAGVLLLKVREYQGLWHICIKPFFILPLGSIVLLGGESWRSLKNPHFPLAQRWLGWGLSLVFRGKNGGIITMKGLRDPFPNHTFKASQFYCSFLPFSSVLLPSCMQMAPRC